MKQTTTTTYLQLIGNNICMRQTIMHMCGGSLLVILKVILGGKSVDFKGWACFTHCL